MPSISALKRSTSISGARVFVGLSGGVDSALSAALLKKAGYDVTGVFIRITLPGYPCTAGEDRISAMRVAAHLNIPFLEQDLSEEYKSRVFTQAVAEFERGRTPNPDALCNREIKFGLFFDWCMSAGAERVATGHYAQTVLVDGRVTLLAGADEDKDQSYFLWAVPERVLQRTLFPIGHLRKTEVRERAKALGLPNAGRKDSQGLCFLGPVSLGDMLRRELEPVAGGVLSPEGSEIGTHEGAALYTLGQRHGFLLHHASAHMLPHYVIDKDMERNTITVSPERFPKDAHETRVELIETNWVGPVEPGVYLARYRYRQKLIPARLEADLRTVVLEEPHYVPEAQSLVLYLQTKNGETLRCAGGGTVDKTFIQ